MQVKKECNTSSLPLWGVSSRNKVKRENSVEDIADALEEAIGRKVCGFTLWGVVRNAKSKMSHIVPLFIVKGPFHKSNKKLPTVKVKR